MRVCRPDPGFHRDRRADGVPIALAAAQAESDRRSKILHHVLQKPQLRTVAIFQEHFQPAVMIEVGEGERPAILDKIQAHGARDVRECSIPIVRIEDIPLVSAPGAIGRG